jgi:outer membrane murein-binding lipoprotein Lpp
MTRRIAFMLFVVVAAALPAQAQGPGGPPPNYQQLASAVATLQSQVDALNAQVSKLQGNITAADLVGTYTYTHLITGLNGGFPARIASGVFTGTFTLAADGTGSGNVSSAGNVLTQGTPWSVTQSSDAETDNFTWTYANGTLTLVMGSDTIPFSVAAGGRLAILAVSAPESNFSGATNLIVLTRLH